MVSLEIPSEVLLFISLFVIVALYFLFFQQYLSALIIRLMLMPLLPKWMKIKFKRHAFSVISGGITLADVEIVTQDMSIRITKLFGSLYYWRKIPDFTTDEPTNSRCKITIYGLEVTILNRTYATELVETVVNMYKEGKTTAEVTEYLKKLYPKPEPYQLSMLYRMILPMEFHKVHARAEADAGAFAEEHADVRYVHVHVQVHTADVPGDAVFRKVDEGYLQ